MKKKNLLRTCMVVLAIFAMNQLVKAQACYPWEVWSCYYFMPYSSGPIAEHCGCESTGDPEAQQCPDGQVLACRYHKCEWECKCMVLGDAAKWIARGNGCHPGGGQYGPNGPYRSSAEQDNVKRVTFFSGISPNPVSGLSTLLFSLSTPQRIRITLFDLNGRLVSTLTDESIGTGDHEVEWNAETVPAGIYILQFQSKELLHTQTVVVTK